MSATAPSISTAPRRAPALVGIEYDVLFRVGGDTAFVIPHLAFKPKKVRLHGKFLDLLADNVSYRLNRLPSHVAARIIRAQFVRLIMLQEKSALEHHALTHLNLPLLNTEPEE